MYDTCGCAIALRNRSTHLGVLRMNGRRSAIEAFDRAAIELHQQIVDILRAEVDEPRHGVQRLSIGERATRQHGVSRERYVAPSRLGQRSDVRSSIRRRLLRRGVIHLLARA